jgi:hypothetical protein
LNEEQDRIPELIELDLEVLLCLISVNSESCLTSHEHLEAKRITTRTMISQYLVSASKPAYCIDITSSSEKRGTTNLRYTRIRDIQREKVGDIRSSQSRSVWWLLSFPGQPGLTLVLGLLLGLYPHLTSNTQSEREKKNSAPISLSPSQDARLG